MFFIFCYQTLIIVHLIVCSRALTFVANSFGGCIQEMTLTPDDLNMVALVTRELKLYIDNMEVAK